MNMKKLHFSNFPLGRKAIIFLGLLVILSSFVSATVLKFIDCRTGDCSGNFSCTGTNTLAYDSAGYINFTMGDQNDGCYYDHGSVVSNDVVYYIGEKWISPNNIILPHVVCDGAYSGGSYCGGAENAYQVGMSKGDGSPNWYYYNGGGDTFGSSVSLNTWYNVSIRGNSTDGDKFYMYIDGTAEFNPGDALGTVNDYRQIMWVDQNEDSTGQFIIQYMCMVNVTSTYSAAEQECKDEISPAPPIISNLNCTSCNYPDGDNVSPYETEDTTPTFKFDTDENAWCAISDQDDNYITMGASRNCTSGEGTQNHICTLTVDDQFDNVGENYLYISCKDSTGNEGNATDPSKSNSGTIVMQIKGASETPGDDAIWLGIDASYINTMSPVTYSGQQVSARNLNDDQFTGTFDWVVAVDSINKRWAFNYVSAGESDITDLFNLTPVLYVLQLINQTNGTVTDQVGKLINSTWNST